MFPFTRSQPVPGDRRRESLVNNLVSGLCGIPTEDAAGVCLAGLIQFKAHLSGVSIAD